MSKSVEQKYKRLSDVEHCLLRPGRYIGSVKPKTAESWVMGTERMVRKELTWNPGLIKLFDEIISNSVDFSKTPEGKHLDTIKVEIDRTTGTISVTDNGGIPVEYHKGYEEFVPSLIFGYLRSGSNFDNDDESDLTGQNGEGASLTNIFSTSFTVETSDGKKRFKQTWTKNMMDKTNPQIIEVESKGFTKITFTPDYAHLETQLDDDNYAKIVKRVYDVAGCNPKLKIYLNGDRLKINSFKDYVSMYIDKFEYDENSNWQIAVAKSEDGFQQVSFVNSTETIQGGTHVYYVWYQIATKLREYIQKKHKIDVKQTEIQSHMQVFINARIIKPRYDSQTKENLMTEPKEYKTSWEISDKFMKKVIDAGIVDGVLLWAEAKAKAEEIKRLRELTKDIGKSDPRRVEKFSDAMEDTDRHLCEIYFTEGDCISEMIEIPVIRNAEKKNVLAGEITVGDLVLTHKNRFRPVTAISYSLKDTIEIKTPLGNFRVAPEHRLLVYSTITNNFDWIQSKNLDINIHKLTRSTIVDIIHAEILDIKIHDDNQYKICYLLGEQEESYISTSSHMFSVFNVATLEYLILEAKDISKDYHFLTFRYKYSIYDRRNGHDKTYHQRVS